MVKHSFLLCFLCLMTLMHLGCQSEKKANPMIIPMPSQITAGNGQFNLNSRTLIEMDQTLTQLSPLVTLVSNIIMEETVNIPQKEGQEPNHIRLSIKPDTTKNIESYRLEISPKQILIEGPTPQGVFYGIQTLRQLLPLHSERNDPQSEIFLPSLTIQDAPRFPWRGLHLDCCRHFMPVDFIKKYLDYMAMYKLNTFHWHLTEDQGWRIEIKAFPKLTELGAWRKETRIGHASENPARFDGTPHGGFYTQDEVRDIVAYAAARFITVVPELEMPGHAQAAIAAYPELGCTGQAVDVWNDWGVSPHIFNVEDSTFSFLEKVIDEMVVLFPGPFFHVGGDEAPKDQWKNSPRIQERMKELGIESEEKLQSYFITRMEKYINAKGKKVIGWDEILEGGLAPNAAVMSWRGAQGGIDAAKAGHHVVMSPGSHCYFDHYQAEPDQEPLAIGGYLPLSKAYGFDPVPEELSFEAAKFVLGGQANLWTEYIASPEHAEYMLFPRISALAEAVWSEPMQKNWPDFKRRVSRHQIWYSELGIHFCPNTLNAPEVLPKEEMR